jgi:hypothetical protein
MFCLLDNDDKSDVRWRLRILGTFAQHCEWGLTSSVVCLCVSPHETNRQPLDGSSWNFMLRIFAKQKSVDQIRLNVKSNKYYKHFTWFLLRYINENTSPIRLVQKVRQSQRGHRNVDLNVMWRCPSAICVSGGKAVRLKMRFCFFRTFRTKISIGMRPVSCVTSAVCHLWTNSSGRRLTRSTVATVTMPSLLLAVMAAARSSELVSFTFRLFLFTLLWPFHLKGSSEFTQQA